MPIFCLVVRISPYGTTLPRHWSRWSASIARLREARENSPIGEQQNLAKTRPRRRNTLKMLNSEDASNFLRCSVRTVEDLARTGRLFGEKFGESWIFPENLFYESVELIVLQASKARASGRAASEGVQVQMANGESLKALAERGIDMGTLQLSGSISRKRGRRTKSLS